MRLMSSRYIIVNFIHCYFIIQGIRAEHIKCRDHDHLTGKYRGPTHQDCNLNYRIDPDKIQIPCFFHNLKNYDAHLLISAVKRRHGEVSVVPNNSEKFITFTIGDVVFKDSYAFTQASLDSLVDNLTIDQLRSTRRWLENSVTRTYDNLESPAGDQVTEEEEDFEDMMFIDDRPIIIDEPSSSTRSRGRYVFHNDNDEAIAPLQQIYDSEISFTERNQRRRMARRIDDDDDDNNFISPRQRRQEQWQQRRQQQQFNADVPFPDSDDEGDEIEYRNPLYEDNNAAADNQGEIEYLPDMVDYDYRLNPPTQTSLSEEEIRLVKEDLKLIKQKGIYPYEYMDSFERFKEPTLPPIEAFYSSLKGEGISKEDYARAQRVFVHFQMHSLQDYHNLYLLQDILLLDDVIHAFRKVCRKTYSLDPLHYYTAPGLTWDAGLKYTGVTLDLLTDEDMFLFVEDGIRGGISMITHRYAKANHPDLEDIGYWDKEKELCNILYLDANNLYGE